ncbi:hypothetical protein Dimus_018410 [Dionaea muscipula]
MTDSFDYSTSLLQFFSPSHGISPVITVTDLPFQFSNSQFTRNRNRNPQPFHLLLTHSLSPYFPSYCPFPARITNRDLLILRLVDDHRREAEPATGGDQATTTSDWRRLGDDHRREAEKNLENVHMGIPSFATAVMSSPVEPEVSSNPVEHYEDFGELNVSDDETEDVEVENNEINPTTNEQTDDCASNPTPNDA